MKIYISNIFPSTIKNKLTKLKDLQTNSFEKVELASKDYGIHYIEKGKGNNAPTRIKKPPHLLVFFKFLAILTSK